MYNQKLKITPQNADRRVMMICPFAWPNTGGVETHLYKLLSFLKKKNVFVYLVTYQPLTTKIKAEREEIGENYVIYRASWFGQGWFNKIENYFPLTFLYLVPGLLLKSLVIYTKYHKDIDVIHAHGLSAAFITKTITFLDPKRSVVSTHAVYNFGRRKLLSKLVYLTLGSFDAVLAVGEASREELIKIGLKKRNVTVHHNWVGTDVFRPYDKKEARTLLNLPLDKFLVLFVGRLIAKKGILVLLEVARETASDIIFVIVGAAGPESDKVSQFSQEHKNLINVTGLASDLAEKQKLLALYYSSADVFVLPSQYNEGFAGVIIEGLACGTPIIATNKGCLPQIIDESVGVMIDPTANNLKNAITNYYLNREQLAAKAVNCRSFALAHFGEINAEVIYNSYHG